MHTRGAVYDSYPVSQITLVIEEWVHNERDRKILSRRLKDGLTFDKLAEEFDMSERQIKNIVYKLQERLSEHL